MDNPTEMVGKKENKKESKKEVLIITLLNLDR